MKKWLIIIGSVLVFLYLAFTLAVYFIMKEYRTEILNYVLIKAQKEIKGKIDVKDLEFNLFKKFPNFSFTLLDASIKDSLYQTNVFQAEKIFLQANVGGLLSGNVLISSITIENGSINLFKNANGYENFNIIRENPSKDSLKKENKKKIDLVIERINLENVKFSFVDSSKNKRIIFQLKDVNARLKNTKDKEIKLNGKFFVNELTFNEKKGSFLKEKDLDLHLNVTFNKENKKLTIDPSKFEIGVENYTLQGFFIFDKNPQMDLQINNDHADVLSNLALLTSHIESKIKKYKVAKPVEVKAHIAGGIKSGQDPHVDISFNVVRSDAVLDTINITNLSFKGSFTNHIDSTKDINDNNSKLQFKNVDGFFDRMHVKANVILTNLSRPVIELDAYAGVWLNDTSDVLHTTFKVKNNRIYKQMMRYRSDKAIQAHVHVFGEVQGQPEIEFAFSTKKSNVKWDQFYIYNADIEGNFTNHINSAISCTDENSEFNLTKIKGEIQHKPVVASLKVIDLVKPMLDLKASIQLPLTEINKWFPKQNTAFKGGLANIHITYKDNMSNYLNEKLKSLTTKISGEIDVVNGSVLYLPDSLDFKKLNAKIKLNDEIVEITSANVRLNNTDLAVKGNIYQIIPYLFFPGQREPYVKLTANTKINLSDLNEWLSLTKYKVKNGKANILVNYTGGIKKYFEKHAADKVPVDINGTIQVDNGEVTYLPRNFLFTGLNTTLSFDKNDLKITNLQGYLNNNFMRANGKIFALTPYLLSGGQKIAAALDIYTPSFDLSKIIGKRKSATLTTKKKSKYQVATIVDKITDHLNTNISLKAGQMKYFNFQANDISCKLKMFEGIINLENVIMKTSDGTLYANGTIDSKNDLKDRAEVVVKMSKMDVNKMLLSFDNFNQHTVTDKNLKGILNADINFSTDLDDNYKVITSSMVGKMNIKLVDGELIDFEPLKKMTKIIFKKRDFMHINFATIENNFMLNGSDLKIERMFVESSVFKFYVEGIYSFKGNTDLSIQVPLSNLKKQKEEKMDKENNFEDKKAGASVFIHAFNKNGKLHMSYDPFHKFKNKKDDPISDSLSRNSN